MDDEHEVEEFLSHYGKRGMKWGSRHKTSGNVSSAPVKDHKKLKIAGVVLVAASVAAGAAYAHHVLGKRGTNRLISNKDKRNAAQKIRTAKEFAEKMVKEEPTDVIHASRGKNTGYTFLKRGGLAEPMHEFEKGFGTSEPRPGTFKRYGKNLEKVAVSFHDPEGRVDRAGRKITHDVILPEQHARQVGTYNQAVRKAWTIIKKDYEPHWQNSLK